MEKILVLTIIALAVITIVRKIIKSLSAGGCENCPGGFKGCSACGISRINEPKSVDEGENQDEPQELKGSKTGPKGQDS